MNIRKSIRDAKSNIKNNVEQVQGVKETIDATVETFNKVTTHFEEHKEAYVAGSSCLVVGLTIGGAVFGRTGGSNINKQIVIAAKTGNVTQNVTQVLVRRGHPGNVIRCIETGETFASQARAAQALGISRTTLGRVLNGAKDSVNGLHFEKLGDAAALGLIPN